MGGDEVSNLAQRIDEHEAWLRENAVECARYNCRLSPTACRQHQAVDPDSCKGCAQRDQKIVKLVNPAGGGIFAARRRKGTNGMAKPARKCVRCGEVKVIQGRGACPACYYHVRKEEGTVAKGAFKMPAEKPVPVKPAAAPVEDKGKTVVTEAARPALSGIDWLFAGEAELQAKVEELARKDRRDVRNEVLCIIEAYLEDIANESV